MGAWCCRVPGYLLVVCVHGAVGSLGVGGDLLQYQHVLSVLLESYRVGLHVLGNRHGET